MDYNLTVAKMLTRMRQNPAIDQSMLRSFIALSPSYLVLDSTTYEQQIYGILQWSQGFHRLVDILITLHARGELELETLNTTSRACSECWSVTASWNGLEEGKEGVRSVAARLKTILDSDGMHYRGRRVYGGA